METMEDIEKEGKADYKENLALVSAFLNASQWDYEKSNSCSETSAYTVFSIKPRNSKEHIIEIILNDSGWIGFEIDKVEVG